MKSKFKNIIFLDVDGVLNCELFYKERYAHLTRYDNIPFYKTVKKHLRKLLQKKEITKLDYYAGEMCKERMSLLNTLCEETKSAVVLSASMRAQWNISDLQEIFNYCGATFTIIDKTPHCECRNRGCEINEWLTNNIEKHFRVRYFNFYRYAIIDDDSDMLLNQQPHFFQTDNYSGLTYNTVYRVKRYLTHKTF